MQLWHHLVRCQTRHDTSNQGVKLDRVGNDRIIISQHLDALVKLGAVHGQESFFTLLDKRIDGGNE